MEDTCCLPVTPSGKRSKLYVVTCISNPCRYRSRYKLYYDFKKMVEKSGEAELFTVEMAFGDRPFVVTEAGNPRHLQLRCHCELWHKENMLNLAIARLPLDWEYMAWVDADVSFARPDWAVETIHQLQHYQVVQMFSTALDLDPNYEAFQKHSGFAYCYNNSISGRCSKNYNVWHPGYAWAARRNAIDSLGGLLDFAILGAADRHMAHALIGSVSRTIHADLSTSYKNMLKDWESRAEKHVRRSIGYVPGVLLHYWHGHKRDRRYVERWSILTKNKFDPAKDLKKDWQGLWQLTENNIRLRDDIKFYFRSRNEDSIDLEEKDYKI